MRLIALTGGIAAGKSTIARRLAEHGAVVIDADRLARDAVALGSPGLERVRERFGDAVLLPDGSLDRPVLGRLVFGDPERLTALNEIVHPEVRRLYGERLDAARAADPGAIVVYDVPLLAEAGSEAGEGWDLTIVAEAPAETRVRRLVELRGLDEDEARRRVASQTSDERRRAIADVVIDTGGTETETLAQVDELWPRIAGPTGR